VLDFACQFTGKVKLMREFTVAGDQEGADAVEIPLKGSGTIASAVKVHGTGATEVAVNCTGEGANEFARAVRRAVKDQVEVGGAGEVDGTLKLVNEDASAISGEVEDPNAFDAAVKAVGGFDYAIGRAVRHGWPSARRGRRRRAAVEVVTCARAIRARSAPSSVSR
jgi:hypothetical protein